MAGLNGWLAARELGIADLTEAVVAEFLAERLVQRATRFTCRDGVCRR